MAQINQGTVICFFFLDCETMFFWFILFLLISPNHCATGMLKLWSTKHVFIHIHHTEALPSRIVFSVGRHMMCDQMIGFIFVLQLACVTQQWRVNWKYRNAHKQPWYRKRKITGGGAWRSKHTRFLWIYLPGLSKSADYEQLPALMLTNLCRMLSAFSSSNRMSLGGSNFIYIWHANVWAPFLKMCATVNS